MLRRLLFALFALGLLVVFPVSALAEETGTISGTVTNGTANGGSVAGLTVTLSRFQGMNLVEDYTTTTDDAGQYRFENLPIVAGEAYIARVEYRDVEYSGRMIFLDQGPNATVDVAVYETTTDSSVVTFVSRGVIVAGVDAENRLVDIFEILALDNASDRAYLGTSGEVLRIPLPDGAAQIEPQPGFDFGDSARMENGQLVTTGAIQPGEQNAMIGYSVPYSGNQSSINIGTAMATQSLRVLVRDGTYEISSPALNDVGVVDVSGDKYRVLSVDRPVVGDFVTVTISGLPEAGGSSSDSSRGPLYAAIAAGVGLVVAGLLVFQTLRSRSRAASAGMPAAPVLATAAGPSLEDERLTLAAELNELDEDLATGKIDQETYNRERQEVIDEMRTISRRMRGLTDAEA